MSLFNKIGKNKLNEMLKIKCLDWHYLVSILVTDYFSSTTKIALMPYLQTDKVNINKILNDLEKRELIYREDKPEDRREKNYIR